MRNKLLKFLILTLSLVLLFLAGFSQANTITAKTVNISNNLYLGLNRIDSFSNDANFTGSNSHVIPTQAAIKTYFTTNFGGVDTIRSNAHRAAGKFGLTWITGNDTIHSATLIQGSNVTITQGTGPDSALTINASSGFANPMSTAQDIIVGGIAGAPVRLAAGPNGTFLGIQGGVIGYYTPPGTITSVGSPNASISFSTNAGAVIGDLNLGHSNVWTAGQNFGAIIASGTFTLTGTTFNPSTTVLDIIAQDTTTGIIYRKTVQNIDMSAATNGSIPIYNSTTHLWVASANAASVTVGLGLSGGSGSPVLLDTSYAVTKGTAQTISGNKVFSGSLNTTGVSFNSNVTKMDIVMIDTTNGLLARKVPQYIDMSGVVDGGGVKYSSSAGQFVGTPAPVGTDITAQTAGVTVATFSVGASNGTFRVAGYVNVTAVATDHIQLQVTYTDENNTSRTISFFPQGTTNADLTSTGNSNYPEIGNIRVKASTTITVATVLTTGGGSITYDAGATISQVR